MLENFIYSQKKSLFLEQLNAGNILDEAIVFIEDTGEIWNHGTYFAGCDYDPVAFAQIQTMVAQLQAGVTELENTVLENEETTAAALNDLNDKVGLCITENAADEKYATNEVLDDFKTEVTNTYVTKAEFEDELNYFYPSNATIEGPDFVSNPVRFTWSTTTEGVNGSYKSVWSLSSDVASVIESDTLTCVVSPSETLVESTPVTLTLQIYKTFDDSLLVTTTKEVEIAPLGAIITSASNAPIQAALYEAGLVEHELYTTQEEAEAITADQLQTGTSYSTSIFYSRRSSITHFEEFEYFTKLTVVPTYLFYNCSNMTQVAIPSTVTSIEASAFYGCSYLNILKIGSQVTTYGSSAFYNCSRLYNLYIDSIEWWLQSYNSIFPNSSSTKRNFFIKGENEEYTQVKEIEVPTTITSIRNNAFYNANITSITLPGSVTTIGTSVFYNCSLLENIYGCSGITSVSYNAFQNVNADVKLADTVVFGLFKNTQTLVTATSNKYSFSTSPMALLLGDTVFYLSSGAYFEDMTTEKTLTLSYTGSIEDLTDNFVIGYKTLTINSNFSETEYTVEYTNTSGESVSDTLKPGTHVLSIQGGSTVKVTPVTTIEDYTAPSAYSGTVSNTSSGTTVTMNYTEVIDIMIHHIDGTLYTTDEWTSNGFANDSANGVAVISASAAFVMAKEDASDSTLAWGGYHKEITGIYTSTNSTSAATDFSGKSNTGKIIDQLTGYTDSQSITGAPAAEACVAYTFPNGSTGYLGSLGEWKVAYSKGSDIQSGLALIGGTNPKSNYYWTSTQYDSSYSWGLSWLLGNVRNGGKYGTYYVRAFSALSLFTINCNRPDVEFQISYTPWNKDEVKTRKYKAGVYTNILPKKDTEVVVSVAEGYEWAELDTTSQTFTYTGADITANFVSSLEEGIFIQHTDGTLYTTTEWTDGGFTNENANGVAVIDSNSAFVIAKEDADTTLRWGGYNKEITTIPSLGSSSLAVLDWDGRNNTPKIIEALDGYNDGYNTGAPAAEYCADYTFPSGRNGYLGSEGEWKTAYNNKTAIVEAMSLIGGTAIGSNYYWTSTQYHSNYSWYLYWYNGNVSHDTKYYTRYVRAFSALY